MLNAAADEAWCKSDRIRNFDKYYSHKLIKERALILRKLFERKDAPCLRAVWTILQFVGFDHEYYESLRKCQDYPKVQENLSRRHPSNISLREGSSLMKLKRARAEDDTSSGAEQRPQNPKRVKWPNV